MTYVLLAVLLVLIISHLAPDLTRLRRFDWLPRWLGWLLDRLGPARWQSPYTLLLVLGAPLFAVALIQSLLAIPIYGLLALAFAIAVLFYCWGPRDLDRDVDALAASTPADRSDRARTAFGQPPPESAAAAAGLVADAARRRWFGPLFWFIVLGPFGAALYRLADLHAQGEAADALSTGQRAAAQRLRAILDWPVAHLMAFGTAIATDFDAVMKAWRIQVQLAGGAFTLDQGVATAAFAVGVKADLEEEGIVEGVPGDVGSERSLVLRDALGVAWRVLIVWMAVLALIVLASLLA